MMLWTKIWTSALLSMLLLFCHEYVLMPLTLPKVLIHTHLHKRYSYTPDKATDEYDPDEWAVSTQCHLVAPDWWSTAGMCPGRDLQSLSGHPASTQSGSLKKSRRDHWILWVMWFLSVGGIKASKTDAYCLFDHDKYMFKPLLNCM